MLQNTVFFHAFSRAEFRPAIIVVAWDWFCMVEFLVAKGAERFEHWKVRVDKRLARTFFTEPKDLQL